MNLPKFRHVIAFLSLVIITAVATFAITYNNTDGDSDIYYSMTLGRGEAIGNTLPEEPEDYGYRFSHWSLTPDGAPFYFWEPLAADTTFYAIWTQYDGYTYAGEYMGYYRYVDDYIYSHYTEYNTNYYADYNTYNYHYTEYDSYNNYYEDYYTDYNAYNPYADINEAPEYVYDYYEDTPIYEPYEGDYHSFVNYYADYYTNYNAYIPYDDINEAPEYVYNYYGDTPIYELYEGDIITIVFMWNRGGQWQDDALLDASININIDYRANVFVYPDIAYGVILDGNYIHVRFPWEIDAAHLGINLPESWKYEIKLEDEEYCTFVLHEDYAIDSELLATFGIGCKFSKWGTDTPTEITDRYIFNEYGEMYMPEPANEIAEDTPLATRTHTVVTIRHDILDNAQEEEHEIIWLYDDAHDGNDGYIGFAPFAFNEPIGFGVHTLAAPFDNMSWILAFPNFANVNRVIVVPQDVTLTAQVNIPWQNQNGHFIITSQDTDLNGSLTNHTAPPTRFTINHTGTGRHFSNDAPNSTITLSHIVLDGGVTAPVSGLTRGGIQLPSGATTLNMLAGSVIRNNIVSGAGGGVNLGGGFLNMRGDASITGNIALGAGQNGGGVHAATGAITMYDTSSITGNLATNNGGGVMLSNAAASLTMHGGTISDNAAGGNGGGIFANQYTYQSPLPAGMHFPQLTIASSAVFYNNRAGGGPFEPPANAADNTNIEATQASGGFSHALNNLDINFALPSNGDWVRLNAAVQNAAVSTIVIHPAGAAGVTDGLDGSTYNLIISPGWGSIINTATIAGAPAWQHPHRILVQSRTVTIQAAPGADIVLRSVADMGRHFLFGVNGHLTLGGAGTGTLTLDGGVVVPGVARGGISMDASNISLTLAEGSVIANSRAEQGGGVSMGAMGGTNVFLTMTGGSIIGNEATGNWQGAAGGGVVVGNVFGGQFDFQSGIIADNHSTTYGGGIYVVNRVNSRYLTGVQFSPNLTVHPGAVFSGNTAGNGSVTPPAGADVGTGIATVPSSGGFLHPLNNLDISITAPPGDWFVLNSAIVGTNATNIVIHPRGTLGVTTGLSGTTYNIVITDPGDGRTITTLRIGGATQTTQNITVTRPVTIQAAPGADIVLRMPTPCATNTPDTAPWLLEPSMFFLSRHFTVAGGGVLTIGGGAGSGTLTLDGNAHLVPPLGGFSNTNMRGGVQVTNGGLILQAGGYITNSRADNGGGVQLGNTAAATFTFNGGGIINNHARFTGGGVFAGMYTYQDPLPAGTIFPQLTILDSAVFSGNTAGGGGFHPPSNAVSNTNIAVTAQRSGGFDHPLNNLDINFFFGDWNRLNTLVGTAGIDRIIIHPAGAGVTPGLQGSDYNLIISPGNGSTIITTAIPGALTADPHRINVTRAVTIQAAPGANIVLDMTATSSANVMVMPGAQHNMGRHFSVTTGMFGGSVGDLTLGGIGSGTLTLNGNADTLDGNRGGVLVTSATLTLAEGSVIYNNRANIGGGVESTWSTINISGGILDSNRATGTGFNDGGGGAIHISQGQLNFSSGSITNNFALMHGGGIFTTQATNINFISGSHYPNLFIQAAAIFSGNVAMAGPVINVPTGALTMANIAVTAQRSGSPMFSHPLNNLDINHANLPAATFANSAWLRLNYAINTNSGQPDTIIIHPAGTTGVIAGLQGTVFNIIVENGHGGNVRTVMTPTVLGSPAGQHAIVVNRPVTIKSAPGADIVLNMLAGVNNGRHFVLNGNGNLTLYGYQGGTLTLEANNDVFQGGRFAGGVTLMGHGTELNLYSGAIIRGSTGGGSGGGVGINADDTTVNMFDGSYITRNDVRVGSMASGGGAIGTNADTFINAVVNIYGGTISYNTAHWGGGIWAMSLQVNMYGGVITGNIAGSGEGNSTSPSVGTTNNPHGGGGGVRICCTGSMVMHGGVISDNAARFGGGVLLSHARGGSPAGATGSTFTWYGGEIIGNRASVEYMDPSNRFDGWIHNGDGAGIFITNAGLLDMRNPLTGTNELVISGNTAAQSGGGVYWEIGRWEAHQRTHPVTIADNEARRDGGGIYLSYQTLNMIAPWRIENNRANRGGGVFLHGDNTPHTYDPALGWQPAPNMGAGTLIMDHPDAVFYRNWSDTSGGAVYIYRDAIFQMHAGAIDYNSSAIFGGGVYVFNPGVHFTSRFEATGGEITRNRAVFGGGVYLMYRAEMNASNVRFAENKAQSMGGAIFTELLDYGYYLSGLPVPHEILRPTPPDMNEVFYAFDNLNIANNVVFADNEAAGAFSPPYNALAMLPNIRWLNYNTAPNQHLSRHIHPLNNYDINFIRSVYLYKTDMEIYAPTPVINNLEGALFILEIWNPATNQWDYYTRATSEANGRVTLHVFTEGEYRLREIVPPVGYVLPPGHWYFEMVSANYEILPGIYDSILRMDSPPPEPCDDNTDFEFILLDRLTHGIPGSPGSDPARMRWHVGNALYIPTLRFIKTCDAGHILPGVTFRLDRWEWNASGGAYEWVEQATQTSSSPEGEVRFLITPNGEYRLVETGVPFAFEPPPGHWYIQLDDSEPGGFLITRSNPLVPEFELRVVDGIDVLHVYNVRLFPDPDWIRLNNAINIMNPAPAMIIIHPHIDISGVTEGMVGTTFNLVVTDPNPVTADWGYTITTLPIPGAPATDPHRISVTRPVTVRAATSADIILRMSVHGPLPPPVAYLNTATIPPWSPHIAHGRHFVVGTGGDFTLGGVGTGNLTLDGNSTQFWREDASEPIMDWWTSRGGIRIEGVDDSSATMEVNSVIYRSARLGTGNEGTGGGVSVVGANSVFTLDGGTIRNNMAVAGGGIYVVQNAYFYGTDGEIINNIAMEDGGGIFTRRYEYENPLTQIPPTYTGDDVAYSNLILDKVYFNHNEAGESFRPPRNAAVVIPLTGFDETSIYAHPLNNYDINFRGEFTSQLFEFYKVDAADPAREMLAGAHFRVFRTPATNTLGTSAAYLVNANGINPLWEEVTMEQPVSQGPGGSPVSFYVSLGYIYQLVEVLAPIGFQIPSGQWRIQIDENSPTGFTVEVIGNQSTPPLFFIDDCTHSICDDTGDEICIDGCRWILPNWLKSDLPLAGGMGMSTLMAVVGAMFIASAGIVIAYTKKSKENPRKQYPL